MALSLEDLPLGTSLAGLNLPQYQEIRAREFYNPTVCGTLHIGNRTHFDVDRPSSTWYYGYPSDIPSNIPSAKREAMFVYKSYWTASGIEFALSYLVHTPGESRRVVVYVCLPYNFNHHNNVLAVGITDPGTEHLDAWIDDMRQIGSTRSQNLRYTRADFYYSANTITVEDDLLQVNAIMGTGHKTIITVEIRSREYPGNYLTETPNNDIQRMLGYLERLHLQLRTNPNSQADGMESHLPSLSDDGFLLDDEINLDDSRG